MSNNKNKKPKVGSFGNLLKEAGIDSSNFALPPEDIKTAETNKSKKSYDENWGKTKSSENPFNKKNDTSQVRIKKRRIISDLPILDLSCYGSNSKKNTYITVPTQQHIDIKCHGDLIENINAFSFQNFKNREVPKNSGIQIQLTNSPNEGEENEIIIGLDFGTSNTKVVIHDPQRNVFYAVPFYKYTSNNPYLYPCRVYLQNNHYSIDEIGDCYANLKLPLLDDDTQPLDLRNAVAFLALIVRHARGWFLAEASETYKNSKIFWELNIGLPTESYEKTNLHYCFKEIALTAINLAGDVSETLSESLIDEYILKTKHALAGKLALQIHPDLVNVYPEISAQVVGFIESDSWDDKDRPFITMIDIGAGTVDISYFSVQGKKGNRKFSFIKNSVKNNGVLNLHRERTNWLLRVLSEKNLLPPKVKQFLKDISKTTTQLSHIPESVYNYILNLEIMGNWHIDTIFLQKYKNQIQTLLEETHRNRVPLNKENWLRLPIFLCGGGSRMRFYNSLIEEINQWHPNWLHVELYPLNKPDNLRAPGLSEFEYDRLSVAYGLSFQNLGKIIQSNQIEDFSINDIPKKEKPIDLTDDG